MRIFVSLTCWTLWIITVLIVIMFQLHLLFNHLPENAEASARHSTSGRQFNWIAILVWGIAALAALLARKRFWYDRKKSAGVGFWGLSLFMYGCIIFIPGIGFAPFFSGDPSSLQEVSLIVAVLLLVFTVPRLPGPKVALGEGE